MKNYKIKYSSDKENALVVAKPDGTGNSPYQPLVYTTVTYQKIPKTNARTAG